MSMPYRIDRYDPCPCGSGKKYKFCCEAKAKSEHQSHGKYPIGTVAYYGPDDKLTTKIAAGVVRNPFDEPIIERFVGTNVASDPDVTMKIKQLFARHGVKEVVATTGNMGCPHEEGLDFPKGSECPFCPFWEGKQGIVVLDEPYYPEEEGRHDMAVGTEADMDMDMDILDPATDASFERINAMLGEGADAMNFDAAMHRLFDQLSTNLPLPCMVARTCAFKWEVPYVNTDHQRRKYERLKRAQPSSTDAYQLLSISRHDSSEWMQDRDDIAAHVQRESDGKRFIFGLSELKATDTQSPAFQLIDDYAVWFWNSR